MTQTATREPIAANTQKGRPRKRRWLRRSLKVVLILLLLLLATGWFVTRPHRLAGILASGLQHLTGATVHIELAHLSWTGELSIEQLEVRLPDAPPDADLLFDAQRITIMPRLDALLGGKIVLHSIVVDHPRTFLVEDADTGRYLHQDLAWFNPDDDPTERDIWPSDPLPDVFVQQAEMHFLEVQDGVVQAMGQVQLGGTLRQDAAAPQTYNFSLLQQVRPEADDPQPPRAAGPLIHGHIDLRDHHIVVQLDDFEFDADQQRLLPRKLRAIWEKMSPTGSLPNLTVRYTESNDAGLYAELHVRDVALNLPIDEINARLTHSTGRFVLDGDRLSIENLTGEIEGIAYRIDGHIEGREVESPFELSLRTEPFDLSPELPYLAGLPPAIQRTYDRLAPSGRFQLEATVSRPTRGERVSYRGKVDLLGAQMTSHRFAYTVHDVHGQIHFNNEQVSIANVHGRGASGAHITLEGEITPPGDGAAVDLRITAENVPVDEHLLAAFKPDERRAFDMFFSEPAYQDLLAQGVIRAGGDDAAGGAPTGDATRDQPPAFALGGTLSITSHVQRAFGPDQPYLATTRVAGKGVRLIYERWPYPLQIVDGTVIISRRHVAIDHVTVRGLTGAIGVIHGDVTRPAQGGLLPELTISNATVPVDDLLLASIPRPQDRWVRQLGVTGDLAAQGRIFRNEQGKIDFNIDMQVQRGRAVPYDGRIALDNLRGHVTLGKQSLRIADLAGDHEGGVLRTDGEIDWGEAGVQSALRFRGEDLPLKEALLDLLPPDHDSRAPVQKLFAEHDPKGRFDAALTLTGLGTEAEDFALSLRPRSLSFAMHGRRIEPHEVSGEVLVNATLVELKAMRGIFDAGWLEASGLVSLRQRGGAVLELSGEASHVDDAVRALLPAAVRDVIDDLSIDASYTLSNAKLQWHGDPATAAPMAEANPAPPPLPGSFAGTIQLGNVVADVGLPVTELAGELQVSADWGGQRTHPRIGLNLHADRLRVSERAVEAMTLRLRSHAVEPMLELDVRGKVYGGVATATGWMPMGRADRFRIDIALQDIDAEAFIAPPAASAVAVVLASNEAAPAGEASERETAIAAPSGGVLSASLLLEGAYGEPGTRRGRGAVQLSDMKLFERPLPLALLQAANLSLPTAGSFDRVSARYRVDGPTVAFDLIRFETPTVTIEGTGTMDYPTQKLDLAMISRSSVGPNLGALSEMLDLFKDELIGIEVHGTLTEPETSVVSFENIRRSWRELFGQSEAE